MSTADLDFYVAQISQHPLLTREQERELGKKSLAGDAAAAEALVTANLRFVVKTAHEYKGYNLPLIDLVQEGNLGLLSAVKKFDPARGYRFISYAVWWIRAFIQNYILKVWSLVRLGTTATQRRLFFKLRMARELADKSAEDFTASLDILADKLATSRKEVSNMETRLNVRDISLDNLTSHREANQMVLSYEPDFVEQIIKEDADANVRRELQPIVGTLNRIELCILNERWMADEPLTLRDIGIRYGRSRERIRQIETSLRKKLKAIL